MLELRIFLGKDEVTGSSPVSRLQFKSSQKIEGRFLGGNSMETVYFAGGCLWGVQHFIKSLPGIVTTEAGRANGTTNTLDGDYDGYAECVKTVLIRSKLL